MLSGDRRYCDTCNVPILERESYYCGVAPGGTAEHLRAQPHPRHLPTFTQQRGGQVFFELCQECATSTPRLLELMQLVHPVP